MLALRGPPAMSAQSSLSGIIEHAADMPKSTFMTRREHPCSRRNVRPDFRAAPGMAVTRLRASRHDLDADRA